MRIMVLGATGFIGPPLIERLAARGHEVVAVSRAGGNLAPARHVACDRKDAAAVAELARAQRIETVIDLIAFTLADTAPLLDSLASLIGRYVLASSGDIYRQAAALHRKEPGGPALTSLDEDAPLRTTPYPYRTEPRRSPDDPQAWMDDYDKIPIEAALRAQTAFAATIARLPMVYGPRDRQRRFRWAIRPMRAGAPVIEIDEAWANWRTSYGYVADVADGLALAATHPNAGGRTYNLGPRGAPDHLAWAHRFAASLDWTGEIRAVPRSKVAEPLRSVLNGLDLAHPLAMASDRIRRELGFADVTDPATALRDTIEDEASRA